MKRLFIPIFIFLIPFIGIKYTYAQCKPDTVHCKDTLLPGEICPRILPDGYVNEQYEEVFTVIPPDKIQNITYGSIDIVKIVIDTVGNLPPGLDYFTNSDTFWVDTSYCVLLSGTPLTSGTYDLQIRVIPFIYLFNQVIMGDPVLDDTSLTITIHEQAGLDDFSGIDFSILNAIPNPYRISTKVGFYIHNQDIVELRIYNLLGQLVYTEINLYPSGKHYFNFTGATLKPGTYIYSVSNSNSSFTRKLIRME